ncbi:response regulator [Candidatus Poribacteria bacterium]|nr:response regulator [Candidatus Poribacteria bacterium]
MDKIIVVDDELDILDFVQLSLEADGFEVITASSGKEALAKIKQESPDLILLDLMMPQMDGYEVMKMLKADKQTRNIPVIMLTALAQADDKVKGLRTGADDYITKPFDLRELTLRVNAVLKRTRKAKYINPLMKAMGDSFTEKGVEQLGYHLETATKIQQQLLPKESPQYENIEIAGDLKISMMVAGDFYDFIPLDDDHIGIAIADISGKGVPAAMLMVMVQTILRLVCREETSPTNVLKRVNDFLAMDTELEMFSTMVYGVLDTKSLTFTYSNGGHCPPIRVNSQKDVVDFLEKGGMLLGIFDYAEFEDETLSLQANDTLVFYTDGVTEAENSSEEVYGTQRLVDVIVKNLDLSAEKLCRKIEEDLIEFTSTLPHSDDLTIVVIKIGAPVTLLQ